MCYYIVMKKFVLLLSFCLLVSVLPSQARNVKVECCSDFSTANPPKTMELKIVSGFTTKDGIEVPAKSMLKGNVINVKSPKRLKRDATFSFIVTEFINAKTGEHIVLKKKIVGKYSTLKIIQKGAIAAGNKIVGAYVGPSIALVQGAIQNEEGNRAKSAAISVYESTPLSYGEKGKELNLKKGSEFVMSFKVREDETESDNFDSEEDED